MNNIPPYDIARSTCQAFQSQRVSVNFQAADAFANELDVAVTKAFGANLAFDANFTGSTCCFENVDSEVAFILLFHALDFGSGWRQQLHDHHGKGAFLTIKAGVEHFFQEHPNLSSQDLVYTTKEEVSKAFHLEGNEDVEDLVYLLHKVIVELGKNTMEYGSLPSYVSKKISDVSKETPAGDLVWNLVKDFPDTFNDCYEVNDQNVCLYKKAQLVVGEIYHRFRGEDERYNFVDGDKLTAYVDNVVCASLRYKKVIVPCLELNDAIENLKEIPMGSEDEVALRAAAMVAVERIVSKVDISSNELGNYLWGGLGKVPEVRKFQRHATKTVFY